jgi:nitroreductase
MLEKPEEFDPVRVRMVERANAYAESLAEVPLHLVVGVQLADLAVTDAALPRQSIVGGASIYPFVWSILLAAREEGLGGVVTTMVIRSEPEVKELLHVPDEFAVAGVVALGKPVKQLRKLTRAPVASFTSVDRFDGEPFREG